MNNLWHLLGVQGPRAWPLPGTWPLLHPPAQGPAPGGQDQTLDDQGGQGPAAGAQGLPAEPQEPDPQHYVPPTEVLTTLGWMKYLEVPYFEYFEWKHLKVVNWFLTDKWPLLQAGNDEEALDLWIKATRVLELDNKARRDLFLLAQSGYVGRTLANKVLFESLNVQAADRQYRDLSNLVSHEVYKHRRVFDRPPRKHGDLACWTWESYISPPAHLLKWAPDQVPRAPEIVTGPGGKPLPPPACWGPFSRW